jgi:CRP-like cAMP-binding protein
MLAYITAPRDEARLQPTCRLLRALPPEELRRLQPDLEPVTLPHRKVLFEVDQPLSRIYLVEAGVVSMVTVFDDGTTVEMATIGREGLVGVEPLLGGYTALGSHVVQGTGSALAIEVCRFEAVLQASPTLRGVCEAYAQAFLAQLLQNVACNAAHAVEQRCARRLLMSHDRSDGNTFTLTQEVLAEMLGVRRSTVTIIACGLQKNGLIAYRRGAITVLDRPGLETAACECYRVIRDRYEQLLPHPFSHDG